MSKPYFALHKNKFWGVFRMRTALPAGARSVMKFFINIGLILFALALAYYLITQIPTLTFAKNLERAPIPAIPYVLPIAPNMVIGLFLILLAMRLKLVAIDAYTNSRSLDKAGEPGNTNLARRLNYYAAELWYASAQITQRKTINNILWAFAKTAAGIETLHRLGITEKTYGDFLINEVHEDISMDEYLAHLDTEVGNDRDITLADLLTALFTTHHHFQEFMLKQDLNEGVLFGAADWVQQMQMKKDRGLRWWLHEHLARKPGIGKMWAYGGTSVLEQFGYDMGDEALKDNNRLIGRQAQIEMLESALLKAASANVFIVGEPGTGKHTVLRGVVRMIATGEIFPQLEFKRVFNVSGPTIVARGKTKGETEAILLSMLDEAESSGDIMLVIEDFPEFIQSLASLGVNTSQLFQPYLESARIQVIGLATTTVFYRELEHNQGLMKYFETVEITEPDEAQLIGILREAVQHTETLHKSKCILTYPALLQLADGAKRYLVETALPERAVDLLEEVVGAADKDKIQFIKPEFVLNFISKKTHIPLGNISPEEQEKLMQLENRMHEQVSGQDEAISAIADTIRRARVGIQEATRPIGTFLFLGPTGVGKTETAKTLAHVYFGNEETMLRFDMTEYQTEEGFNRLLGSLDEDDPGILASQMRAMPYAVVLLDEFEKAHQKVHDLFLQILDEGFFTNAFGERINMRNTIIIATSNAGSSRIAELVEQGTKGVDLHDAVLTEVQQQRIFKPELINRFDEVVVFEPLNKVQLKDIAIRMLHGLRDRLKKQNNIILQLTDPLIEAVAAGGFDPAFGARPMRRFIQDHVEKQIAEKLIKGELKNGDTYVYSKEE